MKQGTKVLLVAVLLVTGLSAAPAFSAERPTFTKDVLPILQDNCQVCHRPSGKNMSGMIAPMSLMTYPETRPWAKAIARVVEAREMPPWFASAKQHGVFANERTLNEEQIKTLVDWVKTGAARGNPNDAPEPVDFPVGWSMGEPDLVVAFNEPFFVNDDVQDLYENITVAISEDELPADKWIQAVEFKPGSEVVHHIIAYSMYPDGKGGQVRGQIGGLAPGTDPSNFNDGFGFKLPKGSSVTFAMHYHKESGPGTGAFDNSIMALKFHDKPVQHILHTSNIAHGAFEIPPFHSNWVVSGAKTFDEDILLVGLMPHGHLRVKAASYTAVYPDGTAEMLLEVPKYDFNWQSSYKFNDPLVLPAGTRIEFEIVYDNSAERAETVGFNPARAVSFGGPTTDEMDLGWFSYSNVEPIEVDAEAGDD